eukprot:CAMPEP_0176033196 /NCGR_PEP_ID=MMETSP0120_2-20121206/16393_1 /TAXON_ID=160619 /ORGANISM="Kryptoperidinium foliaceum, Strain CCMP 1326" /LENGTH=562 /DNA_ID=CAMNT_0017366519 /DNA_START=168 /DNA_END=1856 /DNA_ORIENTATION=-
MTPLVLVRIIEVSIHFVVFLVESTKWFSDLVGPIGLQWYFAICASVMQAESLLWASDFRIVRMLQMLGLAKDMVVEVAPYTVTNFVLYLLAGTCIIFSTPLRWLFVGPLGIAGIVYFLVGSMTMPGDHAQVGILLTQASIFAVAIAGLCASKVASERTERDLFARMTSEKVLRCTAERERELTQGSEGQRGATTSALERSERASEATTGITSRIFASFQTAGTDLTSAFQSLANLGHAEHWAIELDDLAIDASRDKVLGAGGFGFVTQASYHGALVALKVAKHSQGTRRGQIEALAQELRAFRHLRHPNLVLFYGACIDPVTCELMLVMEYVQGLSLTGMAQKPMTKLGILQRSKITYGLACGLNYLHTREPAIIHGDVKSENVIVELRREGVMHSKLLDFGLSRLLTKSPRPLGGTQLWMAPEVRLRTASPSTCADVYSFAWVLYMTMTGRYPSQVVSSSSLMEAFAAKSVPSIAWPSDMSWPEGCEQLCASCMCFDAEARPAMRVARRLSAEWCGKVEDASDSSNFAEVLDSVRRTAMAKKPVQFATLPISDGQGMHIAL